MKASIKFREEQKPLIRAKIPLSILGFPFQSGVVSGDSKELGLSLATSFESGPSLKLAYRPNDSLNPFSLMFKTGIGRFGSPDPSPMIMSAEFNLTGSHNPSFFVRFKPQFGDFSIKKSQQSDFIKKGLDLGSDDDSIEVVDSPVRKGAVEAAPETVTQAAVSILCGLLRGAEASARTSLPVMRRAVVNFRWGFRFPTEEALAEMGRGSMRKVPMLVMNKISIEHAAEDKKMDAKTVAPAEMGDDVAGKCLGVKRQLEMIQCENGMLRKAMEDLRYEFVSAVAVGGGERAGRSGSVVERVKEERDGKEEVKKQ